VGVSNGNFKHFDVYPKPGNQLLYANENF